MISPAPSHTERLTASRGIPDFTTPDSEFYEGLQERIQGHHDYFNRVSPDYIQEHLEFGLFASGHGYRYKARPYATWEKLMDIQKLGHMLRNQSTAAIAVQENFTSYAIAKGITYELKIKSRYRENKRVKRQIERAQEAINQFMSDHCWPAVQEEALSNRLLSSGDLIRQFDEVDGKLDWAFVDAHELRPPTTKGERAPFGIEYRSTRTESGERKPNIRFPKTYWVDDSPVAANRVHHTKLGVDSRDPRGVPLLWMGYTSAREIDELDYAASRSGITYAKHTAIYEYTDDVTVDDIKKIAKGVTEVDQMAKELGKLNAGGSVHHAHKYTVKELAAHFTASGFIELIDYKCRALGNIASVPEFIATGKADTGSRNTLISAEAPLTRRVERIAGRVAKFDIDLLWQVIAVHFKRFGEEAWLEDFKTKVTIKPTINTPDGRDSIERAKAAMDKADRGYGGPITAIKEMGEDPEDVAEEQAGWAKLRGDRDDQLRDDGNLNHLYTADELAKRYDMLAVLITAGIAEDEAIVRLGLDAIEDRSQLEAAIARRNEPTPQPEPEPPAE